MRNGRLAQVGAPQDLYLRPVDEPTASFLGETLVLTAELAHGWADCALGRIAVDDRQRSGPARIMLRPEQIQIGLSDPAQHGRGDHRHRFRRLRLYAQPANGRRRHRKSDQNRQPRRPAARFSGHSQRDGRAHIFAD